MQTARCDHVQLQQWYDSLTRHVFPLISDSVSTLSCKYKFGSKAERCGSFITGMFVCSLLVEEIKKTPQNCHTKLSLLISFG